MQKRTIFSGAAVLLSASLWLMSQPALAHAHLKSSQPAENAEVDASPQTLSLSFTEEVEPAFSGVTLLDSQQQKVAIGKAQLDAGQHSRLILPLNAPLAAGDYQVNWHVLSVDGHKTQGSYRFRVK
ncbi:copper homeostasis periplasmic binding protein CopC [Pantoea sp. KPR_PJ]|uniref:copper homeostasis periplasmic binding protein CopC n=1 Tax=Pantoea sp. KPR_PJ TaxID=2738375 RepID=UPI003527AED3